MSFDFKSSALLALLIIAPCVVAAGREDILVADFEGKDYGDWKVEGEAFGPAPARTDQTKASGYKGEGLVDSSFNGDQSTGTLTSPEFTIDRKFLNLLVGGGGFEGETYVGLLVDGQRVRTAMGPNTGPGGSERLSWVSWDVAEFAGKKGVIQIVDQHTGAGGHISVDHIVLADNRMASQAWWQSLLSPFAAIPWWTLLRLFIALPLPWYLGYQLAKSLRIKEYGWKLGLILCTLASAGVVVHAGALPLGVDLEGGDILVYEVDRAAIEEEGGQTLSSDVWGRLIQAISNRINPSGTKEIVVRRYGEWQIEIIIPKVERRELEQIKKLINTAGALEFRIVAKRDYAPHEYVINLAREQARDPSRRRSRNVRDAKGKIVGYWARVDRLPGKSGKLGPLRVQVAGEGFRDVIRNAATGELVELDQIDLDTTEIDDLMIVDEDPRLHVKGEHLGMVSRGYDETMRPCVRFNMRGQGVGLMGALTGSNLPDEQREFYQRMAILLDGTMLSAPRIMSTITDRGQITGNFTMEEVDFLVGILHAGSLPAAVKQEPISENQIGAVLGEDTIRRGKWAIGISLAAVLLFVLFWYRFAGVVACVALAANLLLILALMISFHAAMTLPGLAGLVLTVGMSVDANVLIFERLREELERGSSLRIAIRNGFSRATTTIVDANLTTLITAIVLYAIGTDQIRGFAVTLILGILMSMYTAIFCARVVFDLFERKRRLKSLRMRRMVGDTHIDFIGKRTIALAMSLLLIVVGLVAVAVRGAQIFDIDFAGGSSVTMQLNTPTREREIRTKLDQALATKRVEGSAVQYTVNRVDVEGQAPGTVWKIDSSFKKAADLQAILQKEFPVATYSMEFAAPTETRITVRTAPNKEQKPGPQAKRPAGAAEAKPEGKTQPEPKETPPAAPATENTAEKPKETPTPEQTPTPKNRAKDAPGSSKAASTAEDHAQDAEQGGTQKPDDSGADKPEPSEQGALRTDLPPENVLAMAGHGAFLLAQAEPAKGASSVAGGTKPSQPAAAEKEKPTSQGKPVSAKDQTVTPKGKAAGGKPAKEPAAKGAAEQKTVAESRLRFVYEINGMTLKAEILDAAEAVGTPLIEDDINSDTLKPVPLPSDWWIEDSRAFKVWDVSLATTEEDANRILEHMKSRLAKTPFWLSSSAIGGQVAGDTRTLAIAALLTSLLGIVGYIWIRFQRVIFGLAAVLALVHDVLITLGAIAISYWLASVLGFLLIEEFKISLPVVAALLTIIGYSLNDTIVVFDRIREVRGKSPELTTEMINTSINQTLSRTLLTSLTTFMVVAVLYALGGEGIHSFAFSLVIGVVVGTYSSIYIASPVLLWMTQPKKATR